MKLDWKELSFGGPSGKAMNGEQFFDGLLMAVQAVKNANPKREPKGAVVFKAIQKCVDAAAHLQEARSLLEDA